MLVSKRPSALMCFLERVHVSASLTCVLSCSIVTEGQELVCSNMDGTNHFRLFLTLADLVSLGNLNLTVTRPIPMLNEAGVELTSGFDILYAVKCIST